MLPVEARGHPVPNHAAVFLGRQPEPEPVPRSQDCSPLGGFQRDAIHTESARCSLSDRFHRRISLQCTPEALWCHAAAKGHHLELSHTLGILPSQDTAVCVLLDGRGGGGGGGAARRAGHHRHGPSCCLCFVGPFKRLLFLPLCRFHQRTQRQRCHPDELPSTW